MDGNLARSADNLIALQNQIAKKVRQELLPALGIGTGSVETGSAPANRDAYEMYLRSAAIPHDAGPNKDAIAMLEKAVKLDPNYAPAWEALGHRYYYDAIYSGGGAEEYQRSDAAYQRALSLEPGRVSAAGLLATNLVTTGNLEKAYDDTLALVKRRPIMHSRIIRWPTCCAMPDCSITRRPNAPRRGPLIPKVSTGAPAHSRSSARKGGPAMEYLDLDAGSEWSTAVKVSVLMREGKLTEARQAAQRMTENPIWMRGFLQACLSKTPKRIAWRKRRKKNCCRNRIRNSNITRARCWQGAAKSRARSYFCKKPWPGSIARARRCRRIRC